MLLRRAFAAPPASPCHPVILSEVALREAQGDESKEPLPPIATTGPSKEFSHPHLTNSVLSRCELYAGTGSLDSASSRFARNSLRLRMTKGKSSARSEPPPTGLPRLRFPGVQELKQVGGRQRAGIFELSVLLAE